MTLNEKQKEQVLKNLARKWPEPRVCSVCKNQEWIISDRIFEIRDYHAGKLMVNVPIYPVIPATCTNCGNTLFFNAITLGIMQPERKEAKNE